MPRRVKIGSHLVGDGEPCFIIAEAGANHDRNLSQAKELIEVATEAGADAVKFQTYSAETLYSKKTPRFSYLQGNFNQDTWQLIKSIELPRQWQQELADYCRQKGIIFLSTPFDYQAVDELDQLGVPAFKVASFEIVDLPLIKYIAKCGKPVLFSTGMANYEEIQDVFIICQSVGNTDLIPLQCVSLYPAPVHLSNLRSIETLKKVFGNPAGYSDHTLGIHIAVAAHVAGANVIEKHFTLSRKLKGPDHPFAIEPDELKTMVKQIREVEMALGDGIKSGPAEEEKEMFEKGRRSIHAACHIPKGTTITREMLTLKRPGFGIKPKNIEMVIGRIAKVDIEEDDAVRWEMI